MFLKVRSIRVNFTVVSMFWVVCVVGSVLRTSRRFGSASGVQGQALPHRVQAPLPAPARSEVPLPAEDRMPPAKAEPEAEAAPEAPIDARAVARARARKPAEQVSGGSLTAVSH